MSNGKYLGQKRPPGGLKFDMLKNRGKIKQNTNNENPKISLTLHIRTYVSLFSCHFRSIQPSSRSKMAKISALCAICGHILSFFQLSIVKTGKKFGFSIFGRGKDFGLLAKIFTLSKKRAASMFLSWAECTFLGSWYPQGI